MNSPRGLIILGAGASREYGFPLGTELIDELQAQQSELIGDVVGILHPSESHYRMLAERRTDHLRQFIADLAQSGRPSIDDFIGRHKDPNYRQAARLLVAAAIHRTQRAFAAGLGSGRPKGWYAELFNWLHLDAATGEPPQHVRIITFNYDLSLELQIASMRRASLGESWQNAWAYACALDIAHVHGSVCGEVEFEDQGRKIETRLRGRGLEECASKLRLVCPRNADKHTREVDQESRDVITRWITEADVIAFLGYGFHPSNNGTLGLDPKQSSLLWNRKQIATTSVGWTSSEEHRIKGLLPPGLSPVSPGWGCDPAFEWFRHKMMVPTAARSAKLARMR